MLYLVGKLPPIGANLTLHDGTELDGDWNWEDSDVSMGIIEHYGANMVLTTGDIKEWRLS